MRVHWLQHADEDGPGTLLDAVQAHGLAQRGTRLHLGEPLPPLDAFDVLIPLGGPMNIHAHAEHTWLAAEKALLREAIAAGKRLFGICLGAQLLADALGGEVARHPVRERGWRTVDKTASGRAAPLLSGLPERFTVFQWHEDSYRLPAGARCLASSEVCTQQAFDWDGGRVSGVQFHPEITADTARRWFRGEEWPAGPHAQTEAEVFAQPQAFDDSARLMRTLLGAVLHTH